MTSTRLRTRGMLLFCGIAVLTLNLTACGDPMGDLKEYVNEVKARKGGHIEPLPQIKPFQTFTYADQDMRSPYVPQLQSFANANKPGSSTTALHPDFTRNHEYLEQFPLDGLKMVGTLTLKGTLFGLVQDSDKIVHRVTVGNYMGQNYGKILSITDSDIKLQEIVPDGEGGWVERVTSVTLTE